MVQDGIGLIGQTLEGRYFLTRALGQGGMGVVFEALDLSRGERCAVKIQKLPADAPNIHTGLQRRFRREALLGQRVRHDGLVAVYDVGELPGGASFLVMELLDGWCLFDVLTGVGPLPWPEAVELALQAAGALAALHRAGIIHRDIKPENLQLLSDGRLKVLDLGVLRVQEGLAVGDAEDTDVRTGSKEASRSGASGARWSSCGSPGNQRSTHSWHRVKAWGGSTGTLSVRKGVANEAQGASTDHFPTLIRATASGFVTPFNRAA